MNDYHSLVLAFAFAAASSVVACGPDVMGRRAAHSGPVAPHEVPSAEREIYSIVVGHAFEGGRPDTLLLVSESPAYSDLPAENFLRHDKAVVPPPLPARLSALSTDHAPVHEEAFPAPVRPLSSESARRLAEARLGGTKVLAVTPVAFTDDSTQALVYYEVWCGRLCGGGYELWFVRGHDGRWRIRHEMTHWVS